MTPTNESIPVIIIDDEPGDRKLLTLALSQSPASEESAPKFSIRTYSDPVEALADLPLEGPAVILCDYRMPGGDGLDWLPDFLKPDIGPVILLTGSGDEQIAAKAFRAGASNYLIKGRMFEHPELLHSAIQDALRRYRLERRNRELGRELKAANKELEKKNDRLRKLSETAQEFVDNVAHEFRTPLAVIKEFGSIISDEIAGPVTVEQTEYLRFIDTAVCDLAQMVDDFLDSGRLRAGALRIDRCPHTIDEIFESVRKMIVPRAAAKNITIKELIDPHAGPVCTDMEKTGRVIVNLAINAIKFSPEGSEIELWAKPLADGDSEIGVTDQGPGLTTEDRERVFNRFKQVGNALQEQSGKGSTFSFTLPPPDPEVIVQRYLRAISELEQPFTISALRVVSVNPESKMECLRQFLSSECYAMDLVLETADEASALVLGVTSEPKCWIDRLRHICSERSANGSYAKTPMLDAQCVEMWTCPEQSEQLRSCVISRMEECHVAA